MTEQDREKIQKYNKKRTTGGNGVDDNRDEQSSTVYAESKYILKLIDSVRQATSDKFFLPEQCARQRPKKIQNNRRWYELLCYLETARYESNT
jgi:hypothetical protein